MKFQNYLALLSLLAPFTAAHFKLDYPAARGFDEEVLGNFPCGGQNTVSSNRTVWPLTGGSIALTMGHIQTNIEVFIGIGNNVGSAFNTIVRPTFGEQGLGSFCMTEFDVTGLGLNITDGTNATIQVVTNGDPNGGLYNCADITFSSSAPAPASGVCTNGTGVITVDATISGLANSSTSATSPTNSASGTASAPASTSTTGAAVERISGGMTAVVVFGLMSFVLLF
ncbi:hypothetical protein B7463_g9594, partial [Scytalidium lignicola]